MTMTTDLAAEIMNDKTPMTTIDDETITVSAAVSNGCPLPNYPDGTRSVVLDIGDDFDSCYDFTPHTARRVALALLYWAEAVEQDDP